MPETDSEGVNKRQLLQSIAEKWMTEGWQRGNYQFMAELYAPDFRDNAPAGRGNDLAASQQGIKELYEAFPDFYATTDFMVIDVERSEVAIHWTAKGTHYGSFMNIAPGHKTINFRGIEIIRIKDGLIVERWGEWDSLDLYQQLSA